MSYARFLLDGQTAIIDDYLEVRPEAADALRRLSASGRVSLGPWMVQMDEFMVSGETIVRDLQFGLEQAARVRRRDADRVPARHLRAHRADAAAAAARRHRRTRSRGAASPRPSTRPASAGSRPTARQVRCEYLYGSYSNGRDIPEDAKGLVLRAADYEQELGDVRLADMLLMNGTDHQMPQPWLGRVVAEANAHAGRLPLRGDVARRSTCHGSRPRTCRRSPASCARARARTCSWASRRTASTCTRRARRPSARSSGRPNRCARCSCPRRAVPAVVPRRRVAEPRAEQRPRLVVRVQPRRSRRPRARPLPGSAPDRRRARARRVARARERGRRAGRLDRGREPDAHASAVEHRRGHRPGFGSVPLRRPRRHRAPDPGDRRARAARATTRWSPARRCGGCST